MQLEQLLKTMLTTNTGIHFMDSGGDNGRAWQRNQSRDFDSEPPVTLDMEWSVNDAGDSSDAVPTVSTYHYMLNSLELDELCNEFNALPCDDWGGDVAYGISEEQQRWLADHGLTVSATWNSYNYESNLDAVLQGANLHTADNSSAFESPDYYLIQLHGGADVRGGYTDAKLFKASDDVYFNTNPTVYGEIDGRQVSTGYNGYSLVDDDGEPVPLKADSTVNLAVEEV